MNTRFKAIACDVDGTILDGQHQVPRELIQLVALLKTSGIIFTLASARPTNSMLNLARELELEVPVIALNGSLIIDSKAQILFNRQFYSSQLNNILTRFPDLLINVYSGFQWIVNRHSDSVALEEAFVAMDAVVSKELPERINMMVAIGDNHTLREVQQYIKEFEPELCAVFSHPQYLHITVAGTCKANGLREFAGMHSLTLNDFIAFGDGENDISMLQNVGLGVAMANASAAVQAAARDVAKSHLELGVVDYLTKLLNIKFAC